MADGGVTEAALLAAAADTAAAGGTAAAGTAAAATAADLAATAAAGTAAGTAAATLPEVAAAAAPEALPFAATAATDAPLTFATSSEPLLGSAVASDAAAPTTTSLLGDAVTPGASGVADTGTGLHSAAWEAGTGQFAPTTQAPSSGLLSQAGQWWNNTPTGTKLMQAQKLLSGVSGAAGAAKAATPAAPAGPKTTFQPGVVGKPQGGEQELAAIVEAMLKRRDAYQQGQFSGAPIVYRPHGLLG